MTLPTFSFPAGSDVSIGSSVDTSFKVRVSDFGDGYTQRSGDGINSVSDIYTVISENLTTDESNAVINFMKSMRGYMAFYWTPPRETVPRKWICKDPVKRSIVETNVDTVSMTFTEVFDPA